MFLFKVASWWKIVQTAYAGGHVERLERVFDMINRPARGKICDAILGIVGLRGIPGPRLGSAGQVPAPLSTTKFRVTVLSGRGPPRSG
jgi:hypothetical protein